MQNIQDNFPDVIRIEVCGKCNFKCIHCPTGTQPNLRGILTRDMFSKIVSQFTTANFVPRVVVLYHGGEPLLNKDLAEFIRTLKELGVTKTVITTNASLLNEQLAEELILAGLDEMKVSFDGESANENDVIRNNGDFNNNAANIINFLELRKSLKKETPQVIISNVCIPSKNIY